MDVTRTFDLLDNYKKNFNRADALAYKIDGKWKHYSTEDYIRNANLVSYGLLALGYNKGDRIITISNNRPEWNFCDIGFAQTGIIHVPIYPTISTDDYKHILRDCSAKAIIVSDAILYRRIKPIADEIDCIEAIYTFNVVENATNWNVIVEAGKKHEKKYITIVEDIKKSIFPTDLVSVIYTSGTTGNSKGVMLSHQNFMSNCMAATSALPLNNTHKVLSFLPLCHVYERLLSYLYQYHGIGIYYAVNMGTIVNNLKEINADGFDTVPRLLEKVYDGIMAKGAKLKGTKRKLFDWAVKLGLRYEFGGKNGLWYELQLKIANKLIFSKWREALGGNIKFIGCGGAMLQPRLCRLFWAAKIPIQEGYGLTETSPLVAINHHAYPDIQFGTVGLVLKNQTVRIAEDGEILVKGSNVMLGYLNHPELTKTAIDENGWFHTGDIGEFVDGRFLRITDRKKEIFKTSSGKYIAPQVIENLLKESVLIEQLMVVGENEKFASAIIVPNFEYLKNWCRDKKISFATNKDIIENKEVYALFKKDIGKLNKALGRVEEIKRFRLVSKEWSMTTGELSPTLKLKRRFLFEKYSNLIDDIYGHKE